MDQFINQFIEVIVLSRNEVERNVFLQTIAAIGELSKER